MTILVSQELKDLFVRIVAENRSDEEWAAIESDDMFQTKHFAGGFDATEGEFCFSYFSPEGEFWFQVSLQQVKDVAAGRLSEIDAQPADK